MLSNGCLFCLKLKKVPERSLMCVIQISRGFFAAHDSRHTGNQEERLAYAIPDFRQGLNGHPGHSGKRARTLHTPLSSSWSKSGANPHSGCPARPMGPSQSTSGNNAAKISASLLMSPSTLWVVGNHVKLYVAFGKSRRDSLRAKGLSQRFSHSSPRFRHWLR